VNESLSLPDPSLKDVLTGQEFSELESLMEKMEKMEFGPGTAGNLLGSHLLFAVDHYVARFLWV
jgi:hypothetical protein